MEHKITVTRESGMPLVILICGSLVYYHCVVRNSSTVSLICDVSIVLLCSFAVLGILFRQMNICVPVDPLEWKISQESANKVAACMATTVSATESVLRVVASGHDKELFLKVAVVLYLLFVLGRATSGATVAYADATCQPQFLNRKRDGTKAGGQES